MEPNIYVAAGVNGAGKSSIMGAAIAAKGGSYFNPDAVTSLLMTEDYGLNRFQATVFAWQGMVAVLGDAIESHSTFAFETTLGGATITEMLRMGASSGNRIAVWYVGLNNVEMHIERVRLRVAAGGHDIPTDRIVQRYSTSRNNLIALIPSLTDLALFDNSEPWQGAWGGPKCLYRAVSRQTVFFETSTPEWANSAVECALSEFGLPN